MKKIITYETIRSFAYVNDKVCKKPIKGIVVYFCGLNNKDMFDEDTNEGVYYGEEGILYVHPYNNPWSWMNAQAVAYTDEIIDGLINGEKALGLVYSGDAAYILSENEDMGFFLPNEGSNLWVDGMVIPSNAVIMLPFVSPALSAPPPSNTSEMYTPVGILYIIALSDVTSTP